MNRIFVTGVIAFLSMVGWTLWDAAPARAVSTSGCHGCDGVSYVYYNSTCYGQPTLCGCWGAPARCIGRGCFGQFARRPFYNAFHSGCHGCYGYYPANAYVACSGCVGYVACYGVADD